MNTHYYYNTSTEWQEERQLLSRFPAEELRHNIKEYGWEFVSGTTNVPISVLNRLLIYDFEEIQKVAKMSDAL